MPDIDKRMGYDPVTICIYDRKKKALLKEPSLIAFDRQNNKILGTGSDALPFLNANNNTLVLSPMKQGNIADYTLSQVMIRSLLQKAALIKPLAKPKIAVSPPKDSTEVEKKALVDALYQSGAGKVLLSEGSIEEMDRTLPAVYNVLIEIVAEEQKNHSADSSWKEVKKGQIPAGTYHIATINSQETGFYVTLVDNSCNCHVNICFSSAFAVRMLEKQVIPDGLYPSSILQKYRQNAFENVIYEIDNGEFGRFFKEAPGMRQRARAIHAKHYLLIGDDHVIEVLSDSEPDIVVDYAL